MKAHIIILLACSLSSCSALEDLWDGGDCEDDQRRAIDRYGQPQDVDTYRSDGYSSEVYSWWSIGRRETFRWGDEISGCDRSVYTFTPL